MSEKRDDDTQKGQTLIRHTVRDDQREQPPAIEWWIESTLGGLYLFGRSPGGLTKVVLGITANGRLIREKSANLPGLQVNSAGQIEDYGQ